MSTESLSVTIRPAQEGDASALDRLAALDSATGPESPLLVAEIGGELVAAVGIVSGEAIADPFKPTSDVLELLATRARRLHPRDGLRSRAARRRAQRTARGLSAHPAGARAPTGLIGAGARGAATTDPQACRHARKGANVACGRRSCLSDGARPAILRGDVPCLPRRHR